MFTGKFQSLTLLLTDDVKAILGLNCCPTTNQHKCI